MKKIFYLNILLIIIAFGAKSQNLDNLTGIQILRSARAIYDQGRLHELPGILEDAIKKNKFQDAEKVEAYKILILTYIYLEEPEKADIAMIHLLNTDHFFEVKPATDPVEFQSLYKKFRTDPIFRVGLKFGGNLTQINVQKNYYIWATSQGKGTYRSKPGIQIGALFEKDLTKKFIINPELFYSNTAFTYSNNSISSVDSLQGNDNATFNISQSRLQLNLLTQYKIGKSKLSPYVAFGPSINYLLNSNINGEIIVGSQETIPNTVNKEYYKTFTYSLIASTGIKYKIGGFYMTVDIRYQFGIGNVVNGDKRYKSTELSEKLLYYGYIDNDFSLRQSMINVGLIIPYYNPKKLIK